PPPLGYCGALPGREEPAQEQGQGAADPQGAPVRGGRGAQARRTRAGAQEPDRIWGQGGEDPHVQFSAEQGDGSSDQPDLVQAGCGDEGGADGVHRRAPPARAGDGPDIGEHMTVRSLLTQGYDKLFFAELDTPLLDAL